MVDHTKLIRISIGSAAVLNLEHIKLDTSPTTCYLMLYSEKKCRGNCGFCPQGNMSDHKYANKLSRVQWPAYDWDSFISHLDLNQTTENSSKFRRVCFQILNYDGFFEDFIIFLSKLHLKFPTLPISAAVPPVSREKLIKLKENGLERIGIALDAATPEIFKKIKGEGTHGPYTWKNHMDTLDQALEIFGKGYVTTHLIIGMGENEQEMIIQINNVIQKRVLPGIFWFMPVKGTPMETFPRVPLLSFRKIQLARFLLLKNTEHFQRFSFNNGSLAMIKNLTGSELKAIIKKQTAFLTAGCPGCNRPYYTSHPGEEPDGFPRPISSTEQEKIYSDLIFLADPSVLE